MDLNNVYKNVDEYISLINISIGYDSAWWEDKVFTKLLDQNKILQNEIESYPFHAETNKALLYFKTTYKKLVLLRDYGSMLVMSILNSEQHKIILENGKESDNSRAIIGKVMQEASAKGAFLNLFIYQNVPGVDTSKKLKHLEDTLESEDKIRMKFNIVNEQISNLLKILDDITLELLPIPVESDEEPMFIWADGMNYLFELFYMLFTLGWIIVNPAVSKPKLSVSAQAQAICALFKVKGKEGAKHPVSNTLETYMRERNNDRYTRDDKPMENLPKERKFDKIEPPKAVANSL